MNVQTTLINQGYGKEIPVTIESSNDHLLIRPLGYGDYDSTDGEGTPIMVEVFEGKLRVIIWSDINQEDPTHIISLEGAKEELRISA
jgi:hypothetical protein